MEQEGAGSATVTHRDQVPSVTSHASLAWSRGGGCWQGSEGIEGSVGLYRRQVCSRSDVWRRVEGLQGLWATGSVMGC